MIIKGIAQWAKILKPVDNYGATAKEYTMDLLIEPEVVDALKEEKLGNKIKEKEGYDLPYIKFVQPEKTRDGELLTPPRVKDRYGRDWDSEVLIGNGSVVNVRFDIREGVFNKTPWRKPALREVQVWEHVPVAPREDFEYDEGEPLAEPDNEVWDENEEET